MRPPKNKLHDAWINELNQAIEDACFALKPRWVPTK